MKKQIIFIAGPTAVGKSEAAVKLARKVGGEIISCDSMQIYQGMEIISSQTPASLRKAIPHHLMGIIPPTKEYNVSLYRKDAVKKIKEIIAKGKVPIFAGGTGLYMSILIDGIFKAKPENKAVRERLYQEAKSFGNQFLYDKLKTADPEAASKIHVNDTKRVVRALEIFITTGKPISQLQKQRKGLIDKYDVRIICLNMERNSLRQKIKERVDKMFTRGLVKEVKGLLELKLSKTASYAIGIKELRGYFDGNYDLNEAKRLMILSTSQYAKRQLTWFRKDPRIRWIEVSDQETPEKIAGKIVQEIG